MTVQKNRKLLVATGIALAVVVTAGAAGLVKHAHHNAVVQASIKEEQAREGFAHEATVQITDQGFMPETITVQKDTRVYFENKSGSEHSLIPDDATRKAEPELGQKEENDTIQTIAIGAGYAYSFHKTGTFHVHDGFNATRNATVIVQ